MKPFILLLTFFLFGLTPCDDSLLVNSLIGPSAGTYWNYMCIGTNEHYGKQHPRHDKYMSLRIPYYCNSSATFQLQLLTSGDINPNPGPLSCNNIPRSSSSRLSPINYDRDELLHLNLASGSIGLNYTLDPSVLDHIKHLGINVTQSINSRCNRRTHRGKKGGRRRMKQLPTSILPTSILPTSIDSHHLSVQSNKNLRFAVWNAHSIKSKDTSTALCDFVISNQLDNTCHH